MSQNMEILVKTSNLSVHVGSRTNPIQILDNVVFTVRAKAITGLIGPSGSGKTTLIRAVIGLIPQIYGQIEMDQSLVRSNIGYMPQDVALHGYFSAKDMLIFSGKVYGMCGTEIEQRIEEFRECLNLPSDLNRRIKTMSVGEQQRISLAMALFHRPKILFLDEPTVGSDPITSWKIWQFLRECRDRYGQTVVITTHYLEEVRKADFVSVMKDGQLIHENSVSGMLTEMQTTTIELAVTKIYQAHTQSSDHIGCPSSREYDGKQSQIISSHNSLSIHKIPETRTHYHLIRASLVRMISKAYLPVFLLFCFGLSCTIAVTIFILSKYLWKAPESSICIVDMDQTAISRTLIQSLHSPWFIPESCSSLEEAHRLVETRKKIGYLQIINDFESSIRPSQSIGTEEVRPQKLRFYGDFSNLFSIEFCRRWIDSRVYKVIKEYRRSKNFSQPLYDIVQIKFFDDEKKSTDPDVSGVFIPICLLFLGFQYANGQSSLRIGFERKCAFHERQQSMGVTWGHQIISYLIRDLFSTSLIYVFTVFVLLLCLGREINMNLFYYLGIVYLVVAASICTGLFLASIIDNLTQAIAILFAINLTVLWFSGCFWSQKSLPYFMSPMNYLVPYNSIIDLAVSFFNDGTSTFNSLECFAPLLAWALFYALAAIRWL
ncbi:uncharacterized protein LOC141857432 [Brevipalpus obovatus]|uniref:uncharacterized protein LOC141857432 n=1 Tax=Brevipalpus obovatus TaxID=246614 RepID=UPI003D9EC832